MTQTEQNTELVPSDAERINRCLAMVLHHEEIQIIAEIAERVLKAKTEEKSDDAPGDA